ncbi:transmembrane protein 50A isoform X1 [Rousettus aegyptiacus]|uniref:transmembrane protein 50A isoform X1 n=1 Tax=Rousettus aegyptiacus TaxID=9407 RepID=UPI00168D7E36|nr:transmembrane protein 50A isoform X1 [Rousettus aegyptiacus]
MHSCVWEAESSRSWLPEHAQRLRAVSVPPSGSPSALSPPIPRPSLRPCLRRRDRALGAVRLHPGIWWPGVVLFSWLKLGAGGFPPPRYTGLRTTARAGLDDVMFLDNHDCWLQSNNGRVHIRCFPSPESTDCMNYSAPFYIRDLSILEFWYLQGSWNQSLIDTK